MPTLDETKSAVNTDLLTMLRDAYFEGLRDGPEYPFNSDESLWLQSDTCKNMQSVAVAIIRSQFDPPHHRLDPSDEARFNAGHKPE